MRSCSALQRTDLLARRIGLPDARRSMSAAFAHMASRSTSANGAPSSAHARSRRAREASGDPGGACVALTDSLPRPRAAIRAWHSRARPDRAEHAIGPLVGKAPVRVQARAHGLEAVPLRVARPQRGGGLEMTLAPVGAPPELRYRRFHAP